MAKYFIRIDYLYRGSPVHRVRCLCPSLVDCAKLVRQYTGEGFMVLSVCVERCG